MTHWPYSHGLGQLPIGLTRPTLILICGLLVGLPTRKISDFPSLSLPRGLSPTPGEPNRARQHGSPQPSFLHSLSLSLSLSAPRLARPPSLQAASRRRQGSDAALASSSSEASPTDKVCPPFSFPSLPFMLCEIERPNPLCIRIWPWIPSPSLPLLLCEIEHPNPLMCAICIRM